MLLNLPTTLQLFKNCITHWSYFKGKVYKDLIIFDYPKFLFAPKSEAGILSIYRWKTQTSQRLVYCFNKGHTICSRARTWKPSLLSTHSQILAYTLLSGFNTIRWTFNDEENICYLDKQKCTMAVLRQSSHFNVCESLFSPAPCRRGRYLIQIKDAFNTFHWCWAICYQCCSTYISRTNLL